MTIMSRPPTQRPATPRRATDEEISRWASEYRQTHPANNDGATEIPFVAEGQSGIVRRGNFVVACARSHTMAKRIANALNGYTPNDKGE